MASPKYTTLAKVKETLQGSNDAITIPTEMTDEKIGVWIEERSREIDTMLPNYAVFPDISAQMNPPSSYGTPTLVERICRHLVVADCQRDLGLDRHSETGRDMTQAKDMYDQLAGLRSGEIQIPADEYDYSQPNNKTARDGVDVNESKPVYFGKLTRE